MSNPSLYPQPRPPAQIEPRYWPCGQCHAESGEMCRTITGNATSTHADRHRSVARWIKYSRDTTRQATMAELISWPCWCGAQIGERCTTHNGNFVPGEHAARQYSADAVIRANALVEFNGGAR
jgi:hypothetical protein